MHPRQARNVRTFLHGDDFATVGTWESVTSLRGQLEGRFEINTECISPAADAAGSRRPAYARAVSADASASRGGWGWGGNSV